MDYNDYTAEISSPPQQRSNRLPIILGLAGVAFGALSFGFVVATAIGGGSNGPAAPVVTTPTEPATTPSPVDGGGTPPPPTQTEPPAPQPTQQPPSGTAVPPTATSVPPTATPVPPTATPTVPTITSPKFHDIFRAEGGTVSRNAKTTLPFRRLEASWNNEYKGCPGPTCIRGRAMALAGVGPLGTGESPVASASVYNTFVAQRSNANLLMDLRWKGSLAAVVGANVATGVEIQVVVNEIDKSTGKVIKAVPNMPYTVLSKELSLAAIQGVDTLKIEDSRSINVPLKLDPGQLYRIDLKITCSTRAAFSASATICSFYSDSGFAGVEWTKQVIEYDTGICSPSQKGDGCIYQD
ncbi:MAG: hypothetical protein AB7N24_05140 [Dehalococcoidia bacterium]